MKKFLREHVAKCPIIFFVALFSYPRELCLKLCLLASSACIAHLPNKFRDFRRALIIQEKCWSHWRTWLFVVKISVPALILTELFVESVTITSRISL